MRTPLLSSTISYPVLRVEFRYNAVCVGLYGCPSRLPLWPNLMANECPWYTIPGVATDQRALAAEV